MLTVSSQAGLYHTENWSSRDTTIFIPLCEDTSLRVHSFDQITYPCSSAAENHFIGDSEERYAATVSGEFRMGQYPIMHCFGVPGHTQKLVANKILAEYFWVFLVLHYGNVVNIPISVQIHNVNSRQCVVYEAHCLAPHSG